MHNAQNPLLYSILQVDSTARLVKKFLNLETKILKN